MRDICTILGLLWAALCSVAFCNTHNCKCYETFLFYANDRIPLCNICVIELSE